MNDEQYHYERLSRSLAEERDELAVELTEVTDALDKANVEAKEKDDRIDLLQRAVDRWADATAKAQRELDIEKRVALELAYGDDKWLDLFRAHVMSRP
ncbi:hypothetical protein UFOVP75_222 [uncultured Caudovirales phage]|uniref:Uncharacterized protein n=1 Tax=uncultured Caudovirales phage TaxID=2100421 RepID=A0A6J5L6G8_9CAUD|nr:hypothetical protein UFOVP75_222 [uncultured Caudovirales phage]